ncbi:MAG: permease-like cell division protein FtsX [Acidimicrobiia bacterium]|nr:permease-like cell division protein FtsX [Acidimicrobiia bacterium]MDH5292708.1 permease-like cell division protein FtsX [Acidimicrobiia bacterium]
MNRLANLIREALINLRRNVLVVTGAVLAVFISLALAFGAVVVNEMLRTNIRAWQEGTHVIAFLKDVDEGGLTPEQQQELKAEVETWTEVKAPVAYVDKLGAYEEFKTWFSDRPELVESIDATVLPSSFRIELNDIDQYQAVTARLDVNPAVKEVKSLGPQIESLSTLSRVLNVLGLGLALVLGVSAVILIANTIRMAIYARRDEVSIMKLVGASNWYIRVPFVLEGLIEGLAGAVLAVLAIWIPSQNLSGATASIPLIQLTISNGFFLRWGVLLVLFGAAAGVIGSLLGLSRYLREADGGAQPGAA